jgi:DNA primase
MAFPSSFLDEVKNRVSVSDIVGRRVKLTRRGREFVGLSPFKSEKTPSFTVNDDKQFYHCFATGKHGSIFDFLMETEGLSFIEAVERLAGDAGLAMPQRDVEADQKFKAQVSLSKWMEEAANWYREQLRTPQAREAREYLVRRGVADNLLSDFAVGYAPASRNALKDYLLGKGADLKDLIEAGLLIQPDDGKAAYDRFRGRIMFPILDARGRYIAFGGRALDPKAPAKYLNSPETPLFHKGSTLYNFHKARQPAYDTKLLLVTEGYMDVIGLSRAGFQSAVAPLGTALTETQIGLLWRLTPEPVLCFDGDNAGLKAAYRAIDRALPVLKAGYSLRFAILPRGKDPDDLAREGGASAIENVIERAMSMVDLLWERELEVEAAVTPEKRAALKQRLRAAIGTIQDGEIRGLYGEAIKERLDKHFAPLPQASWGKDRDTKWSNDWSKDRGAGFGRQSRQRPATAETRRSSVAVGKHGFSARAGLLVLGVLQNPWLLENNSDLFAALDFEDNQLNQFKNEILDAVTGRETLDSAALRVHLKGLQLDAILAQLEHLAAAHKLPFVHRHEVSVDVETAWLESAQIHHTLITLLREKSEAEAELAADGLPESFERLKAIIQEISAVERRLAQG